MHLFSFALLSFRFCYRMHLLSYSQSSILYYNILEKLPRCRIYSWEVFEHGAPLSVFTVMQKHWSVKTIEE